MTDMKMFEFGRNWQSFSRIIDEKRLGDARQSLEILLGRENLLGKTFLDIGCGSGLFSIAAAQLNAGRIVGIDIDPVSVESSIRNAQKWIPDMSVTFKSVSVLDEEQMNALGLFDIVYAWGILHHTGNMRRALELAAQRVKPGGLFVISIYNRHFTSPFWKTVKWLYNKMPTVVQMSLVWAFTPVIFLAKFIVTRHNPLEMNRGMDFMHNVVDWLGGYPYEYASISEITHLLESIGMKILRIIPASVPTGCNEFVCQLPC